MVKFMRQTWNVDEKEKIARDTNESKKNTKFTRAELNQEKTFAIMRYSSDSFMCLIP